MKDSSKNYIQWIQCLTKDQFDELMKIFIKRYFNVTAVVVTDGKGDGGIDVKILEDGRKNRIPIQLTIDKNLYSKLDKDLAKINKLVTEFDYSDTFYFFYSRSAAEGKIIELKRKAWDDYKIRLEIFDAKVLAEYVGKQEYVDFRNLLRTLMADMVEIEPTQFDEYDKLRFDFISFGDESMQLKNMVIESLIIQSLSQNSATLRELSQRIHNELKLVNGEDFIERVVNKLIREEKVVYTDKFKNLVRLSTSVQAKVDDLKKDIELQESIFSNGINSIINEFRLKTDKEELINQVVSIYKASYHKHASEVRNEIEKNGKEESALREFAKYFKSISDDNSVDEIAKSLLLLCEENNFLQKICLGELFCSLVDCSEFDTYRRRLNKSTVIDTPVLLFLVCAMHDRNVDYPNIRYQVACDLVNYINSSQTFIQFMTTEGYVEEVSSHLLNAVKLVPFSELPVYQKLGGSGNIFYEYYLHFITTGILEMSFGEFLSNEFQLSYKNKNEERLSTYLYEYVHRLFSDNGISVRAIYNYEKEANYKEQFSEIKKDLEKIYSTKKNSFRSFKAVRNDTNLLCYLYDEKLDMEEELTDPTVITWDSSFFTLRKRYHHNHPMAAYWHVFRPAKFLDHVALMDFKIDSKAITSEVMTVIEEYNSDIQDKIRCLNDILCQIVDLSTVGGMKLTNGLASIREKHIYGLHKTKSNQTVDINFEERQPVDKLVISLSEYYSSGKGKVDFNSFKTALTNEFVVANFLSYVDIELEHYQAHQVFKRNYLSRLDNIIIQFSGPEQMS